MNSRIMYLVALWLLVLPELLLPAHAQPVSDAALKRVSFDQKLNARISLATEFRNETGVQVRLADYFGKKPVILVLGYYDCPMLCTFVLNGLIGSLQDINQDAGNQFEVIDVSIDPRENFALAAAKKKTYLKRYGRPEAAQSWHFLTGDEPQIRRLANEIGFNYIYDTEIHQYAHPSGLVILTAKGKVSHYLSGVVYSPKELSDALADAASDKVGSPIHKLFLLCFHYSPITGKYAPAIMLIVRICGMGVLLALVVGVVVMLRDEKTNSQNPRTAQSRSDP